MSSKIESSSEDLKQINNEAKRKRDSRTGKKKWTDDKAQVLI